MRTWTSGTLYVSHDRGATFQTAGILERVGTVWPTVNTSMAFIMPDASVANGTHLYVTEDAGYSFSLRELPGAPVVRCELRQYTSSLLIHCHAGRALRGQLDLEQGLECLQGASDAGIVASLPVAQAWHIGLFRRAQFTILHRTLTHSPPRRTPRRTSVAYVPFDGCCIELCKQRSLLNTHRRGL